MNFEKRLKSTFWIGICKEYIEQIGRQGQIEIQIERYRIDKYINKRWIKDIEQIDRKIYNRQIERYRIDKQKDIEQIDRKIQNRQVERYSIDNRKVQNR